ncbi:MAG: FAM83 family protein [Anaerolineae bacterium]|nr:FAM83 family protein [Anaerolineae bacterium]
MATKGKRLGWKEFLLSLFLIIVLWATQEFLGIDLLDSGGSSILTEPQGGIQIAFTAPTYPDEATNHLGGVDESLVTAIESATRSVDVAAYDLDLLRVADALVAAQRRGVAIRLVTDDEYADEAGTVRVEQAGIPVVTDDRDPFMHNKFVVIDEHLVWTGSWNLTKNGTYRNNNNIVMLESEALAENYTVEFEEMFTTQQFGASSPENTPHPQVRIGSTLVETYFAPEEDIQSRIVSLLEEAQSSVEFMAFTITDNEISKALNRIARAGVTVRGVVETRNVKGSGSDVEALRAAGISVLADGNPYAMHHKVIIIDEAVVITGSYNFSRSAAEKNDENVLIIHSSEIAAHYLAEFQRVYQQAEEAAP